MSFRRLRALPALAFFLCLTSSYAQTSVVVLPGEDNYSIVPMGEKLGEGVILFDKLTDGTSSGQVSAGQFSDKGWKRISGDDRIFWDLGEYMQEGTVEFELTDMSKNTKGGWLQPGKQRAYYFGLFNKANGNKHKSNPNPPAFIEIRYNWGSSYACCSAIKFQAGNAGLAGESHEPFGTKPYGDWYADRVYKHKVVFGQRDGEGLYTTLYIDGVWQAKVHYGPVSGGWRYLYLGEIPYPIGGPDGVTYRNVKVTKIK